MTKNKFVLGIDIGGTNIRAGLLDYEYHLSDFIMESTELIQSENQATNGLKAFIKRYLNQFATDKDITAISIGFPSTIDKDRKKLLSTPNIAGLDNIDIVDSLEIEFNKKTYINRDVNMLMLYDMYQRNIPDEGITVGIYLGTGLGNAISIDGRLLVGKNGVAAELGHIPLRGCNQVCSCGNIGCMETLTSGKYLQKLCSENFPDLFIGDIFTKKKDNIIIRNFISDLAIPIATEINILNPDYIILGGGVIQMKDFPVIELEKAIHDFTRKPFPEQDLSIIYSVPKQENGVVGAGIYAIKQEFQSR